MPNSKADVADLPVTMTWDQDHPSGLKGSGIRVGIVSRILFSRRILGINDSEIDS